VTAPTQAAIQNGISEEGAAFAASLLGDAVPVTAVPAPVAPIVLPNAIETPAPIIFESPLPVLAPIPVVALAPVTAPIEVPALVVEPILAAQSTPVTLPASIVPIF
jgi:hypothetical protein